MYLRRWEEQTFTEAMYELRKDVAPKAELVRRPSCLSLRPHPSPSLPPQWILHGHRLWFFSAIVYVLEALTWVLGLACVGIATTDDKRVRAQCAPALLETAGKLLSYQVRVLSQDASAYRLSSSIYMRRLGVCFVRSPPPTPDRC